MRWALRMLVLVGMLMLAWVPRAPAQDFTWSGASTPYGPNWSNAANWSGGVAPAGTVGTLTFPAAVCTGAPCTMSDDVAGLAVSTLDIVETANAPPPTWDLSGANPLTLNSGLSSSVASPPQLGPPTPAAQIRIPIVLGGPNTWTLGTASAVALTGPVSGPGDPVTVNVSQSAGLGLGADVEVGGFTVHGTRQSGSVAIFEGSKLNATDGNPVDIDGASFVGFGGSVGPLTAHGAAVQVGAPRVPAGSLRVEGAVTLDSTTNVSFLIPAGTGATAGADYSQLTAAGPVSLGSALLLVSAGTNVGPAPTCPSLTTGTVYTLISASGPLTGTFAGLPDGATVPACGVDTPAPRLRINYTQHEVTATVVAVPVPVAGRSEVAATVSGVVLVRKRGTRRFTRLTAAQLVPDRSELDTTHGRVRITVAGPKKPTARSTKPSTRSAELYGGRFIVHQNARGRRTTTFKLSEPLRGCRPTASPASTALATKKRRRRRRHVWTTETHGNFNTNGKYASTSVEGTTWLTADTCTTTTVKVKQGLVTVHDRVRRRTLTLHTGQSYTARKR